MSSYAVEEFDPKVHTNLDSHWLADWDEVSKDFLNALGSECDSHGLDLEVIDNDDGTFFWTLKSTLIGRF